jgi:Beta-ketoacyl synthase, N-terminal domain
MEKVDLQTGRSKVAPDYGDKTMPIAIVGMSCRYPGDATDPQRLWKTCAEQRDVWQTTPTERFNQGIFYHPDPGRNGTVSEIPTRDLHFEWLKTHSRMSVADTFCKSTRVFLMRHSST